MQKSVAIIIDFFISWYNINNFLLIKQYYDIIMVIVYVFLISVEEIWTRIILTTY